MVKRCALYINLTTMIQLIMFILSDNINDADRLNACVNLSHNTNQVITVKWKDYSVWRIYPLICDTKKVFQEIHKEESKRRFQ